MDMSENENSPPIKGSVLAFKIGPDGQPKVLKSFQSESEKLALIHFAEAVLLNYREQMAKDVARLTRL